MKRKFKNEIAAEALKIRYCWICRYGADDAERLSLAVRRLFRKENQNGTNKR
ncbi:hypothetical protein LCGC14_0946050 [marine sediment metagenome]|uniref:Uncharacterized protein n=1 Tax=marine sediment metagenome TaxID=412755 RepID=A0A0F9NND2_9ZZZZ